jgi:hypothetical protein
LQAESAKAMIEVRGGGGSEVAVAFLLGKDWNVIAVTFERADLYRLNGNRTKGHDANKIRDNARRHARTIYWAVYDQKGKQLEAAPGPYAEMIPASTMEKLVEDLPTNPTLLNILELLAKGGTDKAAKMLEWDPPAAVAEPKGPQGSEYKLVVSMGEGEEFESSLKLNISTGSISGVLVGPDGEECPLIDPRFAGAELIFDVTLGAGADAARLKFRGKVAQRVVRGTFV